MRILVATGGAPHSDEAVRLGSSIQQITKGMLTLLTVVPHEGEEAKAEAILARAKALTAMEGAATRMRVGRPADEIVQEVAETGYDLLVIGERAHHGLARRLLAPTAEKLVARMPCPVLIARGKTRPLRRALVCESGRDPSLLNRLVNQLAPLLQHVDELTVLHVMSQIAAAPGVAGWELRAGAAELMEKQTFEGNFLEEDLHRLETLNVRLFAKIRHGLVVKEILAETQSGDYDLVVIGAHLSKGWERFLLDDLAQELIHQADRPLLVI